LQTHRLEALLLNQASQTGVTFDVTRTLDRRPP